MEVSEEKNEEDEDEDSHEKSTLISQFVSWRTKKKKREDDRNINVRAAMIHVIGDLIQSIGVVIAGYIIRFKVHIIMFVCVCVCVCVCHTISSLMSATAGVEVGRPHMHIPVLHSGSFLNAQCTQRCLESSHGRSVSLFHLSLSLLSTFLPLHLIFHY